MKKHIGIIGGGAAGMMAAVTAARKGTKVTIFERNDRIGKKILQTGNGKCNLGNKNLTVECYHGGDAAWIKQALERFGTEDTVCFFQKIGLLIKEKNGYLYTDTKSGKKYKSLITLTDKGSAVGQNICRKIDGILDIAGQSLSDGDREIMYRALEQISEQLEEICRHLVEKNHENKE